MVLLSQGPLMLSLSPLESVLLGLPWRPPLTPQGSPRPSWFPGAFISAHCRVPELLFSVTGSPVLRGGR